MTDEMNKENQEHLDASSQQPEKLGSSRRDFTKAGLAGSAILMSLTSRTALGTNYSHSKCMQSNFQSWHPGAGSFNPEIKEDCNADKDCSHYFWKIIDNPYHQQCWNNVAYNCQSRYAIRTDKKFKEIFERYPSSLWEHKTLLDYLNWDYEPQDSDGLRRWRKAACREATVALFNSSHGGICQTYLPATSNSHFADLVSHFKSIDWSDKLKVREFCNFYKAHNRTARPHYPLWV